MCILCALPMPGLGLSHRLTVPFFGTKAILKPFQLLKS